MKGRILIVERSEALRQSLSAILGEGGQQTTSLSDLNDALGRIRENAADLLIVGSGSCAMPLSEMLKQVRESAPDLPVLIVTEPSNAPQAVEATRIGAWCFLQTPIDPEQLRVQAKRAVDYCQVVRENRALRAGAVTAGKPLAVVEKEVILSTLEHFKGHRLKTATALGIGLRTLGMKLKRWREEGAFVETR